MDRQVVGQQVRTDEHGKDILCRSTVQIYRELVTVCIGAMGENWWLVNEPQAFPRFNANRDQIVTGGLLLLSSLTRSTNESI